jgi:hypothetical protein
MGSSPQAARAEDSIKGKIIEAEVKLSVDPGRPLPLGCGLYAIEGEGGVWLCAYYGANRSVFEFLPQKGSEVDERTLGIAFHVREFIPKLDYQPARWEDFKHARLMAYKMEH